MSPRRSRHQLEALLQAVKHLPEHYQDPEQDASPLDEVLTFREDSPLTPAWWEGSPEAFLKAFQEGLPLGNLPLPSNATVRSITLTLRHMYDELTSTEPPTPS
jgi:hypothetical protein